MSDSSFQNKRLELSSALKVLIDAWFQQGDVIHGTALGREPSPTWFCQTAEIKSVDNVNRLTYNEGEVGCDPVCLS
jgi:hypothetical protein